MSDEKCRVGCFYVADQMVYDSAFARVLAQLGFVPMRVEHLAYTKRYLYIGLSFMFNPITMGNPIPEYDVIIDESGPNINVFVQMIKKQAA